MKIFLIPILIALVIYFLIGETNRSINGGKGLLEGAADSITVLASKGFITFLKILLGIITFPIWFLGNAITGKMNYGLLFIIIAIIAFL